MCTIRQQHVVMILMLLRVGNWSEQAAGKYRTRRAEQWKIKLQRKMKLYA